MTEEEYLQIVNFTMGDVNYGVPVDQVREVRDSQAVTPVPGAPPYVRGVTNLRGQIVTIIDLRKRLGLQPKKDDGEKVIIIEMGDYAVGVVVDAVTEVSTIPWKDIERHVDVATTLKDCVIGIGKTGDKLIIIMDIAKIILQNPQDLTIGAFDSISSQESEKAPAK
ncbi:chemotaxis protein CheW [Candidatus Bathyarchaeota archaeon]|nr:chemotaxis protein CheW [Candidatus Bathyarchaeota archaeon]